MFGYICECVLIVCVRICLCLRVSRVFVFVFTSVAYLYRISTNLPIISRGILQLWRGSHYNSVNCLLYLISLLLISFYIISNFILGSSFWWWFNDSRIYSNINNYNTNASYDYNYGNSENSNSIIDNTFMQALIVVHYIIVLYIAV